MTKELDDLRMQVERNGQIEQSAVTLIQGLSQQIKDLKDDPVALAELARQLDQQASDLASAVSANTPSDTSSGGTTNDTVAGGGGNDTV